MFNNFQKLGYSSLCDELVYMLLETYCGIMHNQIIIITLISIAWCMVPLQTRVSTPCTMTKFGQVRTCAVSAISIVWYVFMADHVISTMVNKAVLYLINLQMSTTLRKM